VTVTSSFGGRFEHRVRRRRLSRLAVLLGVLATMAALALGAWLVLGSSLLGVADVQVQGAHRVGSTEVLDRAAIAKGTPLARLDTAAIATNVGRIAAVRSVEVRRDWPRSVTVVVHERVPAAVRPRGTGFVLVDRTGVVFGEVARRPRDLPLVSAPVAAGAPALRAALDALDDVPPGIRDQVRTVRAADAEEVTLQLTRGRTVIWGDPARGSRKGAVLAVLLSRKARIYDVSAPDAPTTRK
jgi:cell division protein FtsQ